MRRIASRSLLFATSAGLAWAAACGGAQTDTPPPVAPPTAAPSVSAAPAASLSAIDAGNFGRSVAAIDAGPPPPPDPARLVDTVEDAVEGYGEVAPNGKIQYSPVEDLELALHDDLVFVSSGSNIRRIDLASGAADHDWFQATVSWAHPYMAADQSDLYVIESFYGDVEKSGPNTVMVAGKPGMMAVYFYRLPYSWRAGQSKEPAPTVYVGQGLTPYGFPAVGGCGLVFFTGRLMPDVGNGPEKLQRIERIARVGGPRTTIVTGVTEPTAIATDDRFVYFTELRHKEKEYPLDAPANVLIRRASCQGGAAVTLAEVPDLAVNRFMRHTLRVDASHAYLAAGGAIRRIPKGATGKTQPEIVATARDFALDDTFVWWGDATGIVRARKDAIQTQERIASRGRVDHVRVDAKRIVFLEGKELRVLPRP